LPESHADKRFKRVSNLIDTLVENACKKRNVDSMVASTTAPVKKSGAPGKPKKGDGQQTGNQSSAAGASATSGKDKDKGKGKGDGKKAKGKGKGKSNSGDVSGSDSDSSTKGNPGKTKAQIDPKQLCCIRHLWGLCKNPEACMHGPHLDKPTGGIKSHFFYIKLDKKFGAPTGPGNPPPGATDADKA